MNSNKIAWIDEDEENGSRELVAGNWYFKCKIASALDEYNFNPQAYPSDKKRLYKTPSEVNLPEAYKQFKGSYEKSTGKSWDENKFMNRASGWLFYGDETGYITVRPQKSGLYKLVGVAGSPRTIIKAFDDLMAEGKPTWGMVSGGIKNMAEKRGMKSPPGWLIKLILSRGIPSAVFGGAEIIGVESDGRVTLKYNDIGSAEKYFIGNSEYYSWLWREIASKIWNGVKGVFGFGK